MLPRAGGYYVYARRAFGDTVGFAVGWTDWLTYCAVLGYVSIGMSEFVALLAPSLGGAVTLDRRRIAPRLRRPAVDGRPRQQPLSGDRDRAQVRRVPGARRGMFRRVAGPAPASGDGSVAPFRADAGWRGRGPAIGRHHLWRLAERVVFHGGRPRSRPQPSAIDDRRRDPGHRHLPAGEPRPAGGAACAEPRSFDAAGGRRRADHPRRPRRPERSRCCRSSRCRPCSMPS